MKKLILSAGHHPEKTGASWNGLREYDFTDKFVCVITDYLRERGYTVENVPNSRLPDKVYYANALPYTRHNAVAVELHFNSAGKTYVEGTETLYYPGSTSGKELAQSFHSEFVKLAGDIVGRDRGVKEGWYRMDRPGVIDFYGDEDGDEMPDYWLRKTRYPALILEPCFMCQLEDMGCDWVNLAKKVAQSLEIIIQ